jgi:hypothetical protein
MLSSDLQNSVVKRQETGLQKAQKQLEDLRYLKYNPARQKIASIT